MRHFPSSVEIVGILDEAFEGIAAIAAAKANVETNCQSSKRVFECELQSAFANGLDGVTTQKLAELCTCVTDGTHLSPPYVQAGIPMLNSKNVQDGFFIDDSCPEKFISRETDLILAKRCKPISGDILISSRGTIGKIAVVRDKQDFNIMGNMILIRLPPKVDRFFVAYYLYSKVQHIASIARGVAQKGLYLNQLREYSVRSPSSKLQTELGARLGALSLETRRRLLAERSG